MKQYWPNPNPRVGVLLRHHNASVRLCNVLWRFRMRGLHWLDRNWPEERMRRELRGYSPAVSLEWNAIVGTQNKPIPHGADR